MGDGEAEDFELKGKNNSTLFLSGSYFFVNPVWICYCRSQIFELYSSFEGSITVFIL
jgi:hypothetical protein